MHYQETSGSQEEKARETQSESGTKFGATKIGDRLWTDWQGQTGLDLLGECQKWKAPITSLSEQASAEPAQKSFIGKFCLFFEPARPWPEQL